MLTSTLAAITPASLPRPGYLAEVADPSFNSPLIRIGGDTGTTIRGIGGLWGPDSRQHYSKDQPWNDDGSLVWIEQRGVSNGPSKLILTGNNYEPLWGNRYTSSNKAWLAEASELRWRPGFPDQVVIWTKGQELVILDVRAEREIWRVKIPSGSGYFGWRGEGTISDDGRWTALCTHWEKPVSTGRRDYVVLIDLAEQRIGEPQDVSYVTHKYKTGRYGEIGNTNISALGNFLMLKLASTPEYGFIYWVDKDNLKLFESLKDLDGLRMKDAKDDRTGWIACLSHADMNLDAGGREVVLGGLRDADYSNVCSSAETDNEGELVMIDLERGTHSHVSVGRTLLGGEKEAAIQHTSGRAYKRRGFHVVSYDRGSGRFAYEIVVWPLDGSKAPWRIGSTRTWDADIYRAEAHAVPNPDLTKVMFASNWQVYADPRQQDQAEVKAYVYSVAAPDTPPPPPPPPDTTPPAAEKRYVVDKNWQQDFAVYDRKAKRPVFAWDMERILNAADAAGIE